MDLRQLAALVAVADHGSFSAAARCCSQPLAAHIASRISARVFPFLPTFSFPGRSDASNASAFSSVKYWSPG